MIIVFMLLFYVVSGQEEGEKCYHKTGVTGTCVNIRDCPAAIDDIRNRRVPQTCGFSGIDTIVCCVSGSPPVSQASTSPPVSQASTSSPRPTQPPTGKPQATTTRRPGSTTTEYTPSVPDYVDNTGGTSTKDGCQAVSPALTAKKTGRKAWDKCIEYQEKLVYPCERGVALTGDLTRANYCMHNADELIIGGVDAAAGEFPHMALLGFGDVLSRVEWQCGGSIISENYILTAGHCLYSRDYGPLTYAMISILKRSQEVDPSKVYKIGSIIKNPDHKPPIKYHDIALLKTENPMKLSPTAVPACLPVGGAPNDARASATGWGLVQYKGGTADTLQKVNLAKFTTEECAAKFPPQRNMKQGFDAATQMCYGDKTMSKDTCQGDSGGPLQIKSIKIHCMYTVIGVTSFGKACGYVGEPGIYTKVEKYTPWIESVVWPDE